MSQWYQVTAMVISQKGHCAAGHKAGDEFTIGDITPKGMCSWAFYTLFPLLLRYRQVGHSPGKKMQTEQLLPAPIRGKPGLFSN